jgi:hypothetical protein
LAKCLILLKTIISGKYGLEVAKQILGKLIQACKTNEISDNLGFLKAAFRAIALHESEKEVAGNMKYLLRLSNGNIATKGIINEFKNIGDVDSRIEFLGKLKEKMSDKEKTEFKDFREGALDRVADQIADEFSNIQNKDKTALLAKLESVDSLRTALLADKNKTPYLADFVIAGKLPGLKVSEGESLAVANELLGCGADGLDKLAKLINDDRLPSLSLWNSSPLKDLACTILLQGPAGLAVVKALIGNGKLKPE